MLREWIAICLVVPGALFMVLAGLGLVRMPDVYTRLSASAKANTLGASLILLGAVAYLHETAVTGRVLAIIVFIALTNPIDVHMISRTAYLSDVPLWKGSVVDEMQATTEDDGRTTASR